MDENKRKTAQKKKQSIKLKTETLQCLPTSCRICLNEGDVHIFEDENLGDISEVIYMFTSVEINAEDNLPQYLCHACNEQLQSAIVFRQTAQETDIFLKKAPENELSNINNEYEDLELCESQEVIFKDTLQEMDISFQCRKCKINFKGSTEYAKHILTDEHRNVHDTCPFCHRTFKCIVTHIMLHKMHKTVMCDICGKKFLKPTYYHHRESHFDNLPLKCPKCPYQGRFAGDLKVHMRKHSGERPYKCKECPQQFTSKSNLNRHTLTHKTVYTYNCELCEKGYFSQRELHEHMAAHTGVKSYSCTECEKSFAYKKGLMRHTLKVHKREKLRSGRIPNYLRVQSQKEDKDEQYIIL
jgi:hypothetical protein